MGAAVRKRLEEGQIPYKSFEGNLLNDRDVENYFSQNSIEQVVHLVGAFDLPFENQTRLNVLTTQKLLEAGTRYGLKKIIFASTGAVYGEPVNTESSETDPLMPNTLYGLSKMYAEKCVEYYAENNGTKYIILRFPNVYGEGGNKGVIANFLNDIRDKKEITLFGDGTQSRNFLHVSDAALAIEKSLYYNESNVFNISNPVKISLNEVVSILSKKYDFSIQRKPANNNLKDLLLNIDKAKKHLRFEPEIKNLRV